MGKTAVGIEVALLVGGEILTADSMQVYRLMDIGTAKPDMEEQKGIPHHLMDLVFPDEPFSVAMYQGLARAKIEEVLARGAVPVMVGGTGLYIKSVVDSYDFIPVAPDPALRADLLSREAGAPGELRRWLTDVDPAAAARIHPNDLRRTVRALEVYTQTGRPISVSWGATSLPYDVLSFGLTGPREWLYRRIDRRVDNLIERGLADEVRGLMKRGYTPDLPSMQGLGYKEMIPHIRGFASLEETRRLIALNTRRFAKRQYTWFRPDRRINWIDVGKPNGPEEAVEEIARVLGGRIRQFAE